MGRSSETLSRLYRGIIAVALIIILAPPFAASGKETKFVGSRTSDKYHYLDCRWAKQIYPENLVYFKSVREERDRGYVPCKVCRPPAK